MLGYLPIQRLDSLQSSMHGSTRSQCQYHFPTASRSALQTPLLDRFAHKRSDLWIHSASTMFRHNSCLHSKPRGWTCLKQAHSNFCIHGGGTFSQRSVPPGGRHFLDTFLHCGTTQFEPNAGPANPSFVTDKYPPLFAASYECNSQPLNDYLSRQGLSGPLLNEVSSLPSELIEYRL